MSIKSPFNLVAKAVSNLCSGLVKKQAEEFNDGFRDLLEQYEKSDVFKEGNVLRVAFEGLEAQPFLYMLSKDNEVALKTSGYKSVHNLCRFKDYKLDFDGKTFVVDPEEGYKESTHAKQMSPA